jgi:hypothetical protein
MNLCDGLTSHCEVAVEGLGASENAISRTVRGPSPIWPISPRSTKLSV